MVDKYLAHRNMLPPLPEEIPKGNLTEEELKAREEARIKKEEEEKARKEEDLKKR